jgi:hypothetical protein
MVDDPLEWLRRLPKGIGYAVIHLEAIEDLEKTITWVSGMGVKVFVALSLETPTRARLRPLHLLLRTPRRDEGIDISRMLPPKGDLLYIGGTNF